MTQSFEVGQMVTVDYHNYLNSLPGLVLDISSSSDPRDTMNTVEVEDHGTHFFYGKHLIPVEETNDELYSL